MSTVRAGAWGPVAPVPPPPLALWPVAPTPPPCRLAERPWWQPRASPSPAAPIQPHQLVAAPVAAPPSEHPGSGGRPCAGRPELAELRDWLRPAPHAIADGSAPRRPGALALRRPLLVGEPLPRNARRMRPCAGRIALAREHPSPTEARHGLSNHRSTARTLAPRIPRRAARPPGRFAQFDQPRHRGVSIEACRTHCGTPVRSRHVGSCSNRESVRPGLPAVPEWLTPARALRSPWPVAGDPPCLSAPPLHAGSGEPTD